jgi:2-polyprenyl-3-methyl-5-hydroxy-6-metoxy-1,4-benzoquinol methylase
LILYPYWVFYARLGIITAMTERDMNKAALRGEPSYVWRAGQQRRLDMIAKFAGERMQGAVLENGCGVGMYVEKMSALGANVTGLEYDFDRAKDALNVSPNILNAAGEFLPLPSSTFDLILSHEVIEHVQNDRSAIAEMVRVLKVGGRAVIFCPNRGYPVETHGIFGKANIISAINYL